MPDVVLVSMPYACVSRRESLSPSLAVGVLKSYLQSQGIAARACHAHLGFHYEVESHEESEFIRDNFRIPVVYGYGLDMLFMSLVEDLEDDNPRMERLLRTYYKYRQTRRQFGFEDFSRLLLGLRRDLLRFTDDVIERLDLGSDTVVAMSCIHGQMFPSVLAAKRIRAARPECKIIFGGIDCHGATAKLIIERYAPYVDAVGIDEGEIPLLRFIESGGVPDGIPGLGYARRADGQGAAEAVILPPEKPFSLSALPCPDFSDFFAEVKTEDRDEVTVPVFASRGCPWKKCTFCNVTVDQHFGYRTKRPTQFAEEIATYQAQVPDCLEYVMCDNDIALSESFYAELVPRLEGKSLLFSGHARADRLTRKMVESMRRCGFYGIEVGIEALSDHILDLIDKGTTVATNAKALKLLRENGIVSWSNIIPHYPKSTPADVAETLAVIEKTKHLLYGSELYLSEFTLYPRCMIWDQAADWGISGVKLEVCDFLEGYSVEKGSWYTLHKHEQEDVGTAEAWEQVKEKLATYRDVFHPCFHRVVDGRVVVYDYRAGGRKRVFRLDDLASRVFLACLDAPRTLPQVVAAVGTTEGVEAALGRLVEQDLVLPSRGKFYYSLPTKIYPAVEQFLAERVEIDADMREDPLANLYADRGSNGDGGRRALLVVDLQKGILAGDEMQALPRRVRDYIAAHGGRYRGVFFSVFRNEPESLFSTRQDYQGCMGSPDIDVADELLDFTHETNTFYRAGFSAFADPTLLEALRRQRISELDVVGVDTDVCVLATVLDAFQHRIMPTVIPELCASSSGLEAHKGAIEFIARNLL